MTPRNDRHAPKPRRVRRQPRAMIDRNCEAQMYAGPQERIVTFQFPNGGPGGRISFDAAPELPTITLYQMDAGIRINHHNGRSSVTITTTAASPLTRLQET